MIGNPFLSDTFKSVWSKYFAKGKTIKSISSVCEVQFIKEGSVLPVYHNFGQNNTNGMYYSIVEGCNEGLLKNGVFVIHDVPTYFNVPNKNTLGIHESRQYNGYLSDFKRFNDFEAFFISQFKSKRRGHIRKKIRELEKDYKAEYVFVDNTSPAELCNEVMSALKGLLEVRYREMKTNSNVLSKWDYYCELTWALILEKKALLSAIKADGKTVAASISFLSNDILFYSVPSFDTNFYNYNLGHTTIYKLQEWCFENNLTVFDFSKGDFEYKKRWANANYEFKHHILYNRKSVISTTIANLILAKFNFKQWLRDRKINSLVSQIKYRFKKIRS